MQYVLETNDLTKKYRKVAALNKVNLRLERGHIYGFVGNNGAGKTTLMRIIAGLSRPTSGSIRLFGAEDQKGIQQNRRRIGVLVESPVYYSNMTARQNLITQSLVQGSVDKAKIKQLLNAVGLDGSSAKKAVKDYSTGMKQRYGIAFALLGNPELLILDEPLNGLDVEGMDDVTLLLRRLCTEQGMTILLSSHLLARLHQAATDYIFINYGEIIEEITAEELNSRCANGDVENYFRGLVRSKSGSPIGGNRNV